MNGISSKQLALEVVRADAGLARGLASEERCPILSDSDENRAQLYQNKKKGRK